MLTQPIGVFGGTFDPIHNGHLAVAEYLFTHCPLAEIQFVPCLQPPHRQLPQASPLQRLEMVRLAIADHPHWIANDNDFQRPAPSYMVDTLTWLRQQQPQTPWCLILGMDAFTHFNEWREWQKILTLAHLIVVNRPDFSLPAAEWCQHLLAQTEVKTNHALTQTLAGHILIQTMPPQSISATHIRHQTNADWKNSLPPAVLHYIQQYHLYNH